MNDRWDLMLILRSHFPIVLIETHEKTRVIALLEQVARLKGQGLLASKFNLAKLADAAAGFSGTEIEQAIVSGLYEAHASGWPLNTMRVLSGTVRARCRW